jgi:hypothetical protein
MPQYQAIEQSGGTWRLLSGAGEPIGRIWLTAHIDRVLRDGTLAEEVAAALSLAGAERRQAARQAYQRWVTAGGHSVDFSTLTLSRNNDAGVEDGNLHLYLGGNELGYLHGTALVRDRRLARFVRLAEELYSAEQTSGTAARNAAIDAVLDRFRDDGGVS